jgi:purine-nucleoside phosphorylase
MADQLKKIKQSVDFLKKNFPKKFKSDTAIIIQSDLNFIKDHIRYCDFSDIPPFAGEKIFKNRGYLSCAKFGKKDVLIIRGRFNYYDGISMRDIGHVIYMLRYLGVKNILSIDEAGFLNPRFKGGELAIVYDHINLMGDNPLIGRNENELGVRFPDMSNAYDKGLYEKIYKVFQNRKIKINEAVILGVPGPGSETEAEARFYREAGADAVGYSMIPENIAAVHAGMNFAGIALLTRELVADKMMDKEYSEEELERERKKNLRSCVKMLDTVLKEIINNL